ncbi:MAG: hypothetical protein ACOYOK_14480, partial [Pseudobdellovibrionaceae bacterium]
MTIIGALTIFWSVGVVAGPGTSGGGDPDTVEFLHIIDQTNKWLKKEGSGFTLEEKANFAVAAKDLAAGVTKKPATVIFVNESIMDANGNPKMAKYSTKPLQIQVNRMEWKKADIKAKYTLAALETFGVAGLSRRYERVQTISDKATKIAGTDFDTYITREERTQALNFLYVFSYPGAMTKHGPQLGLFRENHHLFSALKGIGVAEVSLEDNVDYKKVSILYEGQQLEFYEQGLINRYRKAIHNYMYLSKSDLIDMNFSQSYSVHISDVIPGSTSFTGYGVFLNPLPTVFLALRWHLYYEEWQRAAAYWLNLSGLKEDKRNELNQIIKSLQNPFLDKADTNRVSGYMPFYKAFELAEIADMVKKKQCPFPLNKVYRVVNEKGYDGKSLEDFQKLPDLKGQLKNSYDSVWSNFGEKKDKDFDLALQWFDKIMNEPLKNNFIIGKAKSPKSYWQEPTLASEADLKKALENTISLLRIYQDYSKEYRHQTKNDAVIETYLRFYSYNCDGSNSGPGGPVDYRP